MSVVDKKARQNGMGKTENMLKGRMAETLVEELLRKSGNVVYRFGYEAITQNLVQLESNLQRDNEASERLRAMPDFIVIDRSGKTSFLEVKFRFDSKLHPGDFVRLEHLAKFWGAKFVLVNCREQPYFRIASPPYFGRNEKTLARPLLEEKEWRISRESYRICEELVHRYLGPTLNRPMK